MHRTMAQVASIRLEADGETVARLICDPTAIPAAGQFSLALRPGEGAPLRTAIFPLDLHADGFTTPADRTWQPGDGLDLLGPVGRGFRPPPNARRWALGGIGRRLDRLLPLLQRGIEAGAGVAVWPPLPPERLPVQVEIVRDQADALEWADYIALDVLPDALDEIDTRLRRQLDTLARTAIQVLIAPAMPCGLGLCQACAIDARRGRQLACLDGPVFDWPLSDRKTD